MTLEEAERLRFQDAGQRQPAQVSAPRAQRAPAEPDYVTQDRALTAQADRVATKSLRQAEVAASKPPAEPAEITQARALKSKLGEVEKYHKLRLSDFDSKAGKLVAEKVSADGTGGELNDLENIESQANETVGTVEGMLTRGVEAGQLTPKATEARRRLGDLLNQARTHNPEVRGLSDLKTYREALKQERQRIADLGAQATEARTKAELGYGERLSQFYGPQDVDGIDPISNPKAAAETALNSAATGSVAPAADGSQAATPPPDTSFLTAFKSGLAKPAQGVGATLNVAGQLAGSSTLADIGADLEAFGTDPVNYESAGSQFAATFNPKYLPRAVVEQVGQLAGSILSRVVGAAIGGAVGGSGGSAVPVAGTVAGGITGATAGAFIGPAVFEAAQLVGPIARDRARNEGRTDITREDLAYALGTAAASGSLNSIGAKYLPGGEAATGTFVKRLMGSIVSEGLTEAGQSLVENTGGSIGTKAGVQPNLREALAEGVIGAATGGAATTVEAVIPNRGEGPAEAPAAVPQPLPVNPGADDQPVADDPFTPEVDDELAAQMAANDSTAGMVETQAAEPASASAIPGPISSAPVDPATASPALDNPGSETPVPSAAETLSQEPPVGDVAAPPGNAEEQKTTSERSTPPYAVNLEPENRPRETGSSAITGPLQTAREPAQAQPEAPGVALPVSGEAPAPVSTGPEAEKNMPAWVRERMHAEGINPARKFNDADLENASIQEALRMSSPASLAREGIVERNGRFVYGRRPPVSSVVAQSAEQRIPNPQVAGSMPADVAISTPGTLEGEKINREWTAYAPESESLNIPRAEMPQIPNESRGALVGFLKARGIKTKQEEVLPGAIKPTQAEFSPAKVRKAISNRKEFGGQGRAILISSDGHVVDGHHQWMAALESAPNELMRVIRLNAPIRDLLTQIKEFPSAETAGGATKTSAAAATKPTEADQAGSAPARPTASPATATTSQPPAATSDQLQDTTAPTPASAPAAGSISEKAARKPREVDAKSATAAPIVARGANTPAEFVRAVATTSGMQAGTKPVVVLAEFARRLNAASPDGFRQMEVRAYDEDTWKTDPATRRNTPDSSAAYSPETNTLYLRSERIRDERVLASAIVHEGGHFAENFALPAPLVAAEWAKLTDEQIERAALDYDKNDDRMAKDIRKDLRSRSEWVAQQFARVVTGRTEGMAPAIRERMKQFLADLKAMVTKWLGSDAPSSAKLDAEILRVMGFTEDAKPVANAEPRAKPKRTPKPKAVPSAPAPSLPAPAGDTGPTQAAEKARPSLGDTSTEIWRKWKALTGTAVMSGHTVTGFIADDVGMNFSWGPVGLERTSAIRQRDGTYLATTKQASDSEIRQAEDAIGRGAFQIEERKNTGAGGVWVTNPTVRRMLHQATGTPLADWLASDDGRAWANRVLGTPAEPEAELRKSQSPTTERRGGIAVDDILYRADRPHSLLKDEASAFIAKVGETQALRDALDRTSTAIPEDTKEVVRFTALKQLTDKMLAPATSENEQIALTKQIAEIAAVGNDYTRDNTARALSARQVYGRDQRVAAPAQHVDEVKKRQEQIIGEDGGKAVDDAVTELNKPVREVAAEVGKQAKERAKKVKVSVSVWEAYRADAAKRMVKFVDDVSSASKPQAPLAEFTSRVVAQMKEKLADSMPAKPKSEGRAPTALEILTEAIENRARSKQVFDTVRAEFVKEFGEGSPAVDLIDVELANIGVTPYSKKTRDAAIKDAFKAMQVKVADLAKQHVTKTNQTAADLSAVLVAEVGLKGADAEKLAADLDATARQLIADARGKALERIKAKAARDTIRAKKVISALSKVTTLNNLGALTREDLMHAVAKELKLPTVTPENLRRIVRLADRVETAPNGLARARLEYDLLNELRIVKGITAADVGLSVWLSNLLSGFTTQMANAQGNGLLGTIQLATLMATNPRNAGNAFAGWVDGYKDGFLHARDIFKTGRSLKEMGEAKTGESVENTNVLEVVDYARDFPRLPAAVAAGLQKHAAVMKYVSRAMRAADAVFFYPAREAFARVATAKILAGRYEGKELAAKVRESLGIAPDQFTRYAQQADAEGWNGMDKALRVSQLIEEHRAATAERNTVEEAAAQFARETTVNQDPVGWAGAVYRVAREGTKNIPALKLFLPFLRVPTNLFNTSLNFTPVGAARARFGVKDATGKGRLEFNEDERTRLYFQSVAGSLAMIGIAAAALAAADDEDEPWFSVTAKGTGDWKKNEQLAQTGWREFTVKMGDVHWSYKDSPFLLPLAAVGHVVDAKRYQKTKDTLAGKNPYLNALFKFPQTIFETSMLSGLGTLMDIANGETSPAKIESFIANSATSAAVPNLVKQVDRLVSPERREDDGIAGRLGQSVPGLRQTGSTQTDILGETITRSPLDRFGSLESNDSLREVLRDKNVFVSTPSKSTKLGNAPMTEEQYRIYYRAYGEGMRRALGPLAARMRGMTSEQVEKLVNSAETRVKESAKAEVMRGSRRALVLPDA